jgi:hypothetical protein
MSDSAIQFPSQPLLLPFNFHHSINGPSTLRKSNGLNVHFPLLLLSHSITQIPLQTSKSKSTSPAALCRPPSRAARLPSRRAPSPRIPAAPTSPPPPETLTSSSPCTIAAPCRRRTKSASSSAARPCHHTSESRWFITSASQCGSS